MVLFGASAHNNPPPALPGESISFSFKQHAPKCYNDKGSPTNIKIA